MRLGRGNLRLSRITKAFDRAFVPAQIGLSTHHEYSATSVVADGRCMRSGHDFVIKDGTIKLNLPPFTVATITYKG